MKRQEATKVQATPGEDHGGCEDFGFPGSYRQKTIPQHHRGRNHWPSHRYSLEHDERCSSRNRRPGIERGGKLAELAQRNVGQFAGLSGFTAGLLHTRVKGGGTRQLPWIGDGLLYYGPACIRSSHQQHIAATLHGELDSMYESGFHLFFHRKFQWAHDTKLNLHCESLL